MRFAPFELGVAIFGGLTLIAVGTLVTVWLLS